MRRNRSDGPLNGRTAGRIVAILLLLSGGPTVCLIAQTVPADAPQNAGGLFLLFPVGARAVGMGQSAAAVDCSGDCHTVPAGVGVTHALDVGGQFTVGETEALRIGFVVRNIGFPLQVNNRDQADPLPARLVVGALYRIDFRPFPGGDGKQRLDLKVAADVESPWGEVGTPQARVGLDVGYQRLLRLRGGYAFVHDGLGGPTVGLGVASGSIGVDLAHPFLTGSSLVTANPTYLSFRVTF